MAKRRKVGAQETQSSAQTAKSRYPSLFSDKFITLSQYLAELMCDRRAKTLKKNLPNQFWKNLPEWKNYYMFQLKLARQLCNKYSEHSIYQAVNELGYIYSLRIQKLISVIEKYESIPKSKEEVILEDNSGSKGRFHRPESRLSKLDE